MPCGNPNCPNCSGSSDAEKSEAMRAFFAAIGSLNDSSSSSDNNNEDSSDDESVQQAVKEAKLAAKQAIVQYKQQIVDSIDALFASVTPGTSRDSPGGVLTHTGNPTDVESDPKNSVTKLFRDAVKQCVDASSSCYATTLDLDNIAYKKFDITIASLTDIIVKISSEFAGSCFTILRRSPKTNVYTVVIAWKQTPEPQIRQKLIQMATGSD